MEISIGSKIKHIPSGNIITISKINPKSYTGSLIDNQFQKVRVQKTDCIPYIEPPKQKSFYDIYREMVSKKAETLPPFPKETSQSILWLKAAILEKAKISDLERDSNYYTVETGEKFGFSEHYLNLLMEIAYDIGHRNATENLTKIHKSSTDSMKSALDKIKNALDDANWIEYPDTDY